MSLLSAVARAVVVLATVVGLLTIPTAPAACDVRRALESRAPTCAGPDRGAPTGIIILGGGLGSYVQAEQQRVPAHGPGERVAAGIQLAKRFPGARLLH